MSHSQLIPYVSPIATLMPYLHMKFANEKANNKRDELLADASSLSDYLRGYNQVNEKDEFFIDAQYIFISMKTASHQNECDAVVKN